MTPSQKLNMMNRGIIQYRKKVNQITMNSPMTKNLSMLLNLEAIKTDFPTLESEVRAKSLSFQTKEQIWKMQENWKKQPYKMQRCKLCNKEIPGGQDIFILHLNTHFSKYTEHRSRVEQIESHPYKRI